MKKIEIYAKSWCPYCMMAKSLLKSENLAFTEIDVTNNAELERQMNERSGRFTVPQIFVDNQLVGGFDDLSRLKSTGEPDKILKDPVTSQMVY